MAPVVCDTRRGEEARREHQDRTLGASPNRIGLCSAEAKSVGATDSQVYSCTGTEVVLSLVLANASTKGR